MKNLIRKMIETLLMIEIFLFFTCRYVSKTLLTIASQIERETVCLTQKESG